MAHNERVYVIGAGLSAALGFPLTHDLLVRLWRRLDSDPDFRKRLEKVIKFHHPTFSRSRFTSFPSVEQLLSEMLVNEELWTASRRVEGNFHKEDLTDIKFGLLAKIGEWFNEISRSHFDKNIPDWLAVFRRKIVAERATIVSFNWDLVLDELLFGDQLAPSSYGFSETRKSGPILLKPHGSLNWFENPTAEYLKEDRRVVLHTSAEGTTHLFLKFRSPISSAGRKYNPLIVPPAFLKNFRKPIFEELWNLCVEAIGLAREVVFIGYSLPEADLHARFILRCGIHDQRDGLLSQNQRRTKGRGPAKITIVNPDLASASRIEACIGGKPLWHPMTAAEWITVRM